VTANDFESWSASSLVDKDKHDVPVIRQADVDNQNREGGLWVVADGCVFDVSHLRSHFSQQQVERCICKYIFVTSGRLIIWPPLACVASYVIK